MRSTTLRLVELIRTQKWHGAGSIPVLAHLELELDRFLRNTLAAFHLMVLDLFRVLTVRSNLENSSISLSLPRQLVLHSIHENAITSFQSCP
ncbi:hypothetical protein GGS21DRAFT_196935 [Xylaria nigripes]|nr:hypothetical protein GGS21DRAFT_196935 [Xylaria nigripes]